ncbi:MAG: uracil-DNA glycosylase [Bacteriovoracaceae bacterium]|nr:uracil-DNA glycosylase [Bacteriovoracaceae bacterium]
MFNLDSSWKKALHHPELKSLEAFIHSELKEGQTIYPETQDIFNALNMTPFDQVKVVILGQDPYHGAGQAHGLSFSVKAGVKLPPSLKNIFKELQEDVAISPPLNGDLTKWAQQGVLLLNNVLTVRDGKPGSHHGKGWEEFTDLIIKELNAKRENLVFILWGAPAQKKAASVDESKHLLLKCVHPSPLSSYRGFFGSKPFSKTNAYLESKKIKPIDWRLK